MTTPSLVRDIVPRGEEPGSLPASFPCVDVPELHALLAKLFHESEPVAQHKLGHCVYRLCFPVNDRGHSVIVKGLQPEAARRNQLAAACWLPAIGLARNGPPLLGIAAERGGQRVWHVYEDLGDCCLDERVPDRERVAAAVALIARIHTRFSGQALLAACRLEGADLGPYAYGANVRDAIRSLESLKPPRVRLSSEHLALRDRLLDRLRIIYAEESYRVGMLMELGGAETLLHGDLWPKNILVQPLDGGLQARLIDWDRAGVGPVSYDLSAFLARFPAPDRPWILALYQESVASSGWRLPSESDLNMICATVAYSRLANSIIWPALAAWEEQADWAFDELTCIDEWFKQVEPLLGTDNTSSGDPCLRST